MLAGVLRGAGPAVLRAALPPEWEFLNDENWLLPLIGRRGAGRVGAWLAGVGADAGAGPARFLHDARCRSASGRPIRESCPTARGDAFAAEHRRDIAALPLALLFQVAAIFLTPMLAVIQQLAGLRRVRRRCMRSRLRACTSSGCAASTNRTRSSPRRGWCCAGRSGERRRTVGDEA